MKSLKNYIDECYATPMNTIGMNNVELSTDVISLHPIKKKKLKRNKKDKGVI